jgi:hypothetical protein
MSARADASATLRLKVNQQCMPAQRVTSGLRDLLLLGATRAYSALRQWRNADCSRSFIAPSIDASESPPGAFDREPHLLEIVSAP